MKVRVRARVSYDRGTSGQDLLGQVEGGERLRDSGARLQSRAEATSLPLIPRLDQVTLRSLHAVQLRDRNPVTGVKDEWFTDEDELMMLSMCGIGTTLAPEQVQPPH